MYSNDKFFEMAKNGQLPVGFNQWDLVDRHGRTVAHEAAFYGHLPDDFDRKDLLEVSPR